MPPPVVDAKQGDIYWVDIPVEHTVGSEQYKRRPYVIVSRTLLNRSSRTVIAVPLSTVDATTAAKHPPHRILIPAQEINKDIGFGGTVHDSVAKTDQVRVLDKQRLQNKMGTLSATAVAAVGLGLAFLLDLR